MNAHAARIRYQRRLEAAVREQIALETSKEHHAAMSVHTMQGCISDLLDMLNDSFGYETVRSNKYELEQAFASLGKLLTAMDKREAA